MALSIYLDISGFIFAQENISKKRKINLSNWAEPEGPTQPPSAFRWPGRGPRGAHVGPHRAAAWGGCSRAPPYKAAAATSVRRPSAPCRRPSPRPAAARRHRAGNRAGCPDRTANCRRWPSDSGLLPPSSTPVSTHLRSPRSPLSVLHLTQASSCSELHGFDAPVRVRVPEKLLSVCSCL
jgi:hypothetical protein